MIDDMVVSASVLDLYRRLPVRMAIFRIFALDERGRGPLVEAAHQVLAAA